MRKRTSKTLTEKDAAIIKGMRLRGDANHRIAAWFDVNQGRIAEINTGQHFRWVQPVPPEELPPPGPYKAIPVGEAFDSQQSLGL